MFKNLIKNKPSIVDKIENTIFKKDNIFSNINMLDKGVFKETIEENSDVITLNKSFVSRDGSFRKIETTTMSKESFKAILSSDLISLQEIDNEIESLDEELDILSSNQQYEECAIFRDKILILKKLKEFLIKK